MVMRDIKDVTVEIIPDTEAVVCNQGDDIVTMGTPVGQEGLGQEIQMEGIEPLQDTVEDLEEDQGQGQGQGYEAEPQTVNESFKEDSPSKGGKKPVKEPKDKSVTPRDVNKGGVRSPRKRKDEGTGGTVPHTKSPRPPRTSDASPKPDTNKTSQTAKSTPRKSLVKPTKTAKEDSEKKQSASKLLKNVSNKKKSEGSSLTVKTTLEKKGISPGKSPEKEKEKKLLKARKELDLLTSVPSEIVSPHLTTIEARPVTDGSDGEMKKEGGATSKAPRRTLQPRKYGNVTSQIDSGRKPSLKPPDSKPSQSTSQVLAAPKAIPKPRGGLPRPSAGTSKRTSLGASKVPSGEGQLPKPSRLASRLVKPTEGSVSDSQLSLGSDRSGRESSGASSRQASASKYHRNNNVLCNIIGMCMHAYVCMSCMHCEY